jgi:hypothetical protein
MASALSVFGMLEFARREPSMSLIRTMALLGAAALATGLKGEAQRAQTQPSITYGMAKISLGMTVEQVEQHLAEAARHIKKGSDKDTALVYLNGESTDFEGQITFASGHVIYADYHMPTVSNADELAQEIAGAVDNMETKTCEASNYSAHGTGGGFSQIIFQCGSRRFNVMTVQVLGNATRTVNVNIEIGQTVGQ